MRKPMARWAIFDVDGTLLPHCSMESMFVRHAIRTKEIRLSHFNAYILEAARAMFNADMKSAFKMNRYYLKECQVTTMEQLAEDFFKNEILPRFSGTATEKVAKLRNSGFKILILTGTPEFLARNLSSVFNMDYLICTKLETRNGRFTGKILGDHPYGACKREILLRIKDELKIDFNESVTFANHETDAIHMELFGKATAVNPTRRLRQIAEVKGWKIVKW